MTNLYINLDRNLADPLHKQLIIALKENILSGEIGMGGKLPSSRKLANDIGVSRIVTLAAYEQLIAEGYLVSRSGSGTYVSNNIPSTVNSQHQDYVGPTWFKNDETKKRVLNEATYNFSVGQPAPNLFPESSWRRAWRRALSHPFVSRKPDPTGDPRLREVLVNYLKRARNITTTSDNIVITTGAAETLRLISKAMTIYNPDTYLESPGFGNAWRWLSECGKTIPLSVDDNGLKAADLPDATNKPTMLFLTPSHQFPLGFRLSLKRRNKILKWAQDNDALILEDDYDSEFHYESMALPTLKAQDTTGSVLYFSSFSKSISPNVKIGYLIAPKSICKTIANIITEEHSEPPYLMQNAMAHFINSGDLDKHIARSRRHYTKLNKIMRDKLSKLPNGVVVSGLDSGIHAFMSFEKFPTALIKRLTEQSFYLPHQTDQGNWRGFALGYGHFTEDGLNEALDRLISNLSDLYPEL